MTWMEREYKVTDLRKIETEMAFLHRIIKRQLKFLVHIMKKEILQNLTHSGYTEGKTDRGKGRVNYIDAWKNRAWGDSKKNKHC